MTLRDSPKRVLMIDDEEALLVPMARYFRRLGCTVLTACEREEAEALLEHQTFDVIVLDLALSDYGLDGLEMLRTMRHERPDTPILVLSGMVTPDVAAEAERRGADAVLVKPQPLADIADVAFRLMDGAA